MRMQLPRNCRFVLAANHGERNRRPHPGGWGWGSCGGGNSGNRIPRAIADNTQPGKIVSTVEKDSPTTIPTEARAGAYRVLNFICPRPLRTTQGAATRVRYFYRTTVSAQHMVVAFRSLGRRSGFASNQLGVLWDL